jgi:hypothetical protein
MLYDDRRYLKKHRLFDRRRQCLKRRLVMGIVLESLERSLLLSAGKMVLFSHVRLCYFIVNEAG